MSDIDENLENGADLDEEGKFSSSYGDPSEVPHPTTKKVSKRKGDKDQKLDAHVPASKAGMINAVVKKLGEMTKEELEASYGRIMNIEEETEEEEEYNIKSLPKLTAEDIDLSEDVNAMFNGVDLDENFKIRAATIFEAAVVNRVNEQVEKIAVDTESEIEVAISEATEELEEKINSYLDYVVNEWVEENKLAIETGVRSEMVEDFMKGLKNLFTEHYVDIPEEKVDVVEEMIEKIADLEEQLSEVTDRNVKLSESVKALKKEVVFAEVVEGLTAIEAEKLAKLTEGVEFVSEKEFAEKLNILKEQYFSSNEETNVLSEETVLDDNEDPLQIDEEKKGPSGVMGRYVQHISKSVRK